MIDIIEVSAGPLGDINLYDTQTCRAANILSVQLGDLEYAQAMGIDLRYFLSENVKFQNESFKSYLVEVLANNGINVTSVLETLENLFSQYTINLSPEETTSGMVAR